MSKENYVDNLEAAGGAETTSSSISDLPPPSYDEIFNPSSNSLKLEQTSHVQFPILPCLFAVDFAPDSPNARFTSLVAKANHWLAQNREYTVKSCETLAFRSNAGVADTSKVTFSGDAFMHCLRIWLIPQPNPNAPPTVINYFNIAPKLLSAENKMNPIFEDMKTLISKLNATIMMTPVPGQIICVDCVSVPYHGAKHELDCIDPDKLLLVECAVRVLVLRTFYIVGSPTQHKIALTDFYPRLLDLRSRDHEPFSDLVQQVSDWLAGQQICNIQTSSTILQDDVANVYPSHVVSLRVFTLQPTAQNQSVPIKHIQGTLMSKTFFPVQLTCKEHFKNWNQPPQFETIQQTISRINNWVKENNVVVVSAETKAIQMYPKVTDVHGPQSTDIYPSKDNNHIWMIRVYVDGVYPDPPISMCPISYRGWNSKPVEDEKSIPPSTYTTKNECKLM